MPHRLFPLLCLITLLAVIPARAQALTTDWEQHPEVGTRLLVAQSADGEVNAGIEFRLAEGWKTYWRTPGDAGLPLTLDFSASENLKQANLLWPVPTRLVEYKIIQSFIYKHHIILPLRLQAEDPAKPILLKASGNYGVCSEICVFYNITLDTSIPASHSDAEAQAALDPFMAKVPAPNGAGGLEILSAQAGENNTLNVKARAEDGFSRPELLVEISEDFRFTAPEATFSADWKEATFSVPYELKLKDASLKGKTITLTLINGDKVVEAQVTEGQDTPSPAADDVKKK
ncbi:MAG: hypothetical protein H6908_06010 [Hyphomicrobiales bacterium]|nr:hypothetical protein [Hyphomicrobiales bacterium]